MWKIIPENIRNLASFNIFKGSSEKIRKGNDALCSCRIYKPYIEPPDLI